MFDNYRMIAIDLDGTLLTPGGEVTPRVRTAIHRALDVGLLICFATGRNWTESRTVLDAVGHYPTAVFAGGAIVIDTRQQVTLHQTRMDPRLAADVSRTLETRGHAVLALQDSNGHGVDYLISDLPINDATRQWLDITGAVVHHVPRLADYPHERTLRVGIVARPDEVEQVNRELDGRYGERVLVQCLHVPTYGVDVLEVFDPAVNKWEGILHIARKHDISPDQIVAIGDDINDLPMIQNAGLGVAMGNARSAVLESADLVIGRNHEEGLAVFLEQVVESKMVTPIDPGDTSKQETGPAPT